MACLKIIKGNEFLIIPLKPGTSILFNKKIAEILDFDKTSNTHSYNIDVPESDELNKYFEWASDLTHNSTMRGATVPAILECDGIPLRGFLKINGHQGRYYQTQFISGNFSWWLEMSNKPLCELGFDNIWSWDSPTLETKFAPGGLTVDDTAGYADGGEPCWVSLKEIGIFQEVLENVFLDKFVKSIDLRPDWYAKALIDKAFSNSPFTYKSKFFQSEKFRKVLQSFAEPKKFRYNKTSYGVTATQTVLANGFPDIFLTSFTEVSDPEGYWNDTGDYFEFPVDGDYEVEFNVTITYTNPSNVDATFEIQYEVDGAVPPGVVFATRTIPANSTVTLNIKEIFPNGVAGHFVNFYFVLYTYMIGPIYAFEAGSSWDSTIELNIINSDGFDILQMQDKKVWMNDWLPCNETFGEFIRGLIHCFNLQVSTDPQSNVVTFEPYDSYYIGNSDYEDWSDIVDCTKIVQKYNAELKKDTVFKFLEDSTDSNKPGYKELYQYINQPVKRDFTGQNKSENPFFAPTFTKAANTDTSYPCKAVLAEIIKIDLDQTTLGDPDESIPPLLVPTEHLPRILFKCGYKAYTGESWKWTSASNVLTRIPKALQVGDGAHLGFDDSLFVDYYERNFQDLENAPLQNAKVGLDFNRFVNADFTLPKLIQYRGQNLYFRLLSIEGYNPEGKTLTDCSFQVWKK